SFLVGTPGSTRTVTVLGTGVLTLAGGLSESTNAGINFVINPTTGVPVVGTGTVRMLGTSDYPGPTEVDSGTFEVDGSLNPAGTVTVVGGLLDGTGSVGRVVAAGGTVDPGV